MQDPLYLLRGVFPQVVEHIRKQTLADMTKNLTLQSVGLYSLIFACASSGKLPSTNELAELSGVTVSHIQRLAADLVSLGVVKKQTVRASHGRGRLNVYEPVRDHDELKLILGPRQDSSADDFKSP